MSLTVSLESENVESKLVFFGFFVFFFFLAGGRETLVKAFLGVIQKITNLTACFKLNPLDGNAK